MLCNRHGRARRPFSAYPFLLIPLLSAATARAGDFGAVSAAGTWSNPSTWTPAGVPAASDNVYIGSTNPAGAASTATVTLTHDQFAANLILGNDSGNSGTLNLGNFNLTVSGCVTTGNSLGATGSILRGSGSFTAAQLNVANANTFNFGASDGVGALESYGSGSVTTSSSGNVTASASIHDGGSLSLGADMLLNDQLDLRDGGSTLNMAGHKLSTTNNIYLGWHDSGVPTLVNRGPLATANLFVANQPFSLLPSDAVANFYVSNVSGGTLTDNSLSYLELQSGSRLITTATGNITGSVSVNSGSKLTAGADLVLNNYLDLHDTGSTLDLAGHNLSASSYVYLGWLSPGLVSLMNPGSVTTGYLYIGNSNSVAFPAPGSAVDNAITLSNNSILTLRQPGGQMTGMTFLGSSSDALGINDTSVLQLSAGSGSGPGWLFRWQDQAAGTWETALDGLIAAGRVTVSSSSGYSVFDEGGFTYVATASTVIWNGGGANNNWSTAANWGGTAATAGHWLRFGALAAGGHVSNFNNLPPNSLFYGIFFDCAAPAYNLQGNAIQLSGFVVNQSGSNQTIGLNIQLVPGNGAFDQGTFDVATMQITDSGMISGAGMELVKTGSGTLVLSPGAAGNTYSGGTEVLAGELIATSPDAILDGSDLIVGADAAALFAAPVVAAPSASIAVPPQPVPEAGTMALFIAALIAASVPWGISRRAAGARRISS